ncbi:MULTISPECIES: RluA family pseudouridine synthase [unclassified Fibrobacter]|uniref:RluA family pseudouridine synthase n=1 Tax=unclassified Fibrobacter TaxID=2634177 RepID=UPI0025C06817|nr:MULTISPECIES: RluA family pseudouridine synthase [unclassified Fibrobacter]
MNYLVQEKHSGERIDKFLVGAMENVSRTDVQKLIAAGEVKVGGAPASKNFRVETGMVVVVEKLIEKPSSTLEPEDIPLDIVYEDEDIVVLNKPRNLVVHPGSGVSKGTLAAGLLHHFKDNLSAVNGPLRPGIVHRLDKDTPGLMVVAKNDAAHRHLAHQLETRTLHRTYNALVWGCPRDLEGCIDAPIGRNPKNRLKMAVVKGGRESRTHFVAKQFFAIATLLELQLESGRTHQIRVHTRYTGHPVVGDPLYDGREESLNRVPPLMKEIAEKMLEIAPAQLLQAVKIELIHPRTGKKMKFKVPMEEPFAKVLKLLKKECPADAPVFDEEEGFHEFDADIRFDEGFDDELDEESLDKFDECVFPELKERKTRAQRHAEKAATAAQRRAKAAERKLIRQMKSARRKGISAEDFVEPGYEPTIDPDLL